jgi:uncharacterized membrane protein
VFDEYLAANIMIVYTLVAIGLAFFRNPHCFLALSFSLLSARLLTEIGQPHLHYHILFFCSLLCVCELRGFKFRTLDIAANEVNYAVGFLYIVRMVAGAGMSLGLMGVEAAWIVSTSVLALQNFLVIAGALDGTRARVNAGIANFRRGCINLVLQNKRL